MKRHIILMMVAVLCLAVSPFCYAGSAPLPSRQITPEKRPSINTPGQLVVITDPENVTIKIVNIDKVYHPGIELLPGRYHLRVWAHGHRVIEEWIKIFPGEERKIYVRLPEKQAADTPSKVSSEEAASFPAENAIKVALFPWVLTNETMRLKTQVASAVIAAVDKTNECELLLSYYKTTSARVWPIMRKMAVPSEIYNAISRDPKIDRIRHLGRRLGVDAVIIGIIAGKNPWSDHYQISTLDVAIIDVATGRLFPARSIDTEAYPRDSIEQTVVGSLKAYTDWKQDQAPMAVDTKDFGRAGSFLPSGSGFDEKKIKVALFPWMLAGEAKRLKVQVASAVSEAISEGGVARLTTSSYLTTNSEVDTIPRNMVSAGEIYNRWNHNPKAELIAEIGNKLGVDVVLAGRISASNPWSDHFQIGTFDLFLVDVRTKQYTAIRSVAAESHPRVTIQKNVGRLIAAFAKQSGGE